MAPFPQQQQEVSGQQQRELSSSSSVVGISNSRTTTSSAVSLSSSSSFPFLLLVGCCLLSIGSIMYLNPKTTSTRIAETNIVVAESASALVQESAGSGSLEELSSMESVLVSESQSTTATATTTTTPAKEIFQNGEGTLRIPTPIFVTSLPKSGTTSTWKYFACGLGKRQAAHTWANLINPETNSTSRKRLGKCFQDNLRQQRPMLENCGNYNVYSDSGYMAPGQCYYPSIHGGLQALFDTNPNATLLQVVRNTEAWVNSTLKFNDLWTRWTNNKCDQFPTKATPDLHPAQVMDLYGNFYEWHTQHVRQFAKDHPTMTYIEVSLESNTTPTILQDFTGINASCWMNKRPKHGSHLPKQQKRKKQKQNVIIKSKSKP